MEQTREQPWAEHEKVYLLAEIIKAHPLHSHVLFNIIRDCHIQPKWTEIALPQGRSLRSCQVAYQDLSTGYSPPESRQQSTQFAPPVARYPIQNPPDVPPKRLLQPELSTPTGRLIQPRPPHAYPLPPDPYAASQYPVAPPGEPPHKKKRGRPTKAEAQARADAAAARGEIYPPPNKRKPRQQSGSGGEIGQGLETPTTGGQTSLTDPTTSTTTTTTTTVTTPKAAQAEAGLESSGRRRRGRPSPLELGARHEEGEPLSESPIQRGSGVTEARPSYLQPTPASEAPSSATTDRRERDIRQDVAEDYPQHQQQLPHQQQSSQQQQQQQQQQQTATPRSFKETVGM